MNSKMMCLGGVVAALLVVIFERCASGQESMVMPRRPRPIQVIENERVQSLPEAFCRRVVQPDVIEVDDVGPVKLIGIHAPKASDFGYSKALAATRKFVEKQNVRLDFCPILQMDEQNHLRAVVYYSENGNWYNLNTKIVRSGLAAVVREPTCHLHTEGWQGFAREAKEQNRGIFHEGGDFPLVYRADTPFAFVRVSRKTPSTGIGAAADRSQATRLGVSSRMLPSPLVARPPVTPRADVASTRARGEGVTGGASLVAGGTPGRPGKPATGDTLQPTGGGLRPATPTSITKVAARSTAFPPRTGVKGQGQAASKTPPFKTPPVWLKFEPSKPEHVTARYVGSIHSKRFHRLHCLVGPRELDRVYFPSRIQALKHHFQPCLVCRP